MGKYRRYLSPLVSLLAFLTAAAFLYVAYWAYTLYRAHGALPVAALRVAESQWLFGIAYLAGAILYRPMRRRALLQVLGTLAGVQSAGLWLTGGWTMAAWNFVHGDIVAIGCWAGLLQILTGAACVLDFIFRKRR